MASSNIEPVSVAEAPTQDAGFDCEFIEVPPKSVQHECPICLHILKEPYQATCCGYSFCRMCIDRVKQTNKPYPTCNAQEFEIFPYKGLQRSLYEFKVHCTHKENGCKWTGELGDLTKHLNCLPADGKQSEGCDFAWIKCAHCPRYLKRSDVSNHQENYCSKQPFRCEYCNEYQSDFEDVSEHHWLVCSEFPVTCPDGCGVSIERKNLQAHKEECPLVLISCEFSTVGCVVKIARKDMPEHVQTNLTQHMSLLAASHAKLTIEHAGLKLELQRKDEAIEQLRQEQRMLLSTSAFSVPVQLTMKNFTKLRSEDAEWISPPFYTRPHGYKMCIKVYPNGNRDSKGKATAAFLFLMPGEYDDTLTFPINMKATVGVVTITGRTKNNGAISYVNNELKWVYWGRSGGRGGDFIQLYELSDFITQHDTVVFEVSKVIYIDA